MTQCQQVLDHLRRKGSITQKEAAQEYQIYRLAARIYDLRQDGHEIEKKMEKGKGDSMYARYYLKQPALSL